MNATTTLRGLISRRHFTVLGYSAEGSTWCPHCLRSAADLSPSRGTDTDGKPIVPLYAADRAKRLQDRPPSPCVPRRRQIRLSAHRR